MLWFQCVCSGDEDLSTARQYNVHTLTDQTTEPAPAPLSEEPAPVQVSEVLLFHRRTFSNTNLLVIAWSF